MVAFRRGLSFHMCFFSNKPFVRARQQRRDSGGMLRGSEFPYIYIYIERERLRVCEYTGYGGHVGCKIYGVYRKVTGVPSLR